MRFTIHSTTNIDGITKPKCVLELLEVSDGITLETLYQYLAEYASRIAGNIDAEDTREWYIAPQDSKEWQRIEIDTDELVVVSVRNRMGPGKRIKVLGDDGECVIDID